jgi:hypothetical protein
MLYLYYILLNGSIKVHLQLNIASVLAVSHNSEMSQQNSEALKVTDFVKEEIFFFKFFKKYCT